jgi:branched-chain amino acid transport system substrate-binding protein
VRRPATALAALALAAALAGGATPAAGSRAAAGTPIVLGGLAGQSTPARAAAAYFRWVNARGGVGGRPIDFRLGADGGDLALALDAARRLVERDGVLALVDATGAGATGTTADSLAAAGVSELFARFRPSARAEGRVYGAYLARARPGSAVAVLRGPDDEGAELLAGLRLGVARSSVRVAAVARLAASTELEARLAVLQASGADALVLAVEQLAAVEAYAVLDRLGWRPLVLVAARASAAGELALAPAPAVEGSISLTHLKDPTDPRWRDDAGLRLFRTVLARFGRGVPRDLAAVQGMAVAFETVRLLRALGPAPTRGGVASALGRFDDASSPFLLPGVDVRTGPGDRSPVERAQLRRFAGGGWRGFGGLWPAAA